MSGAKAAAGVLGFLAADFTIGLGTGTTYQPALLPLHTLEASARQHQGNDGGRNTEQQCARKRRNEAGLIECPPEVFGHHIARCRAPR